MRSEWQEASRGFTLIWLFFSSSIFTQRAPSLPVAPATNTCPPPYNHHLQVRIGMAPSRHSPPQSMCCAAAWLRDPEQTGQPAWHPKCNLVKQGTGGTAARQGVWRPAGAPHGVGVLSRAAEEGGADRLCAAALFRLAPGEGVPAQLELLRTLQQQPAEVTHGGGLALPPRTGIPAEVDLLAGPAQHRVSQKVHGKLWVYGCVTPAIAARHTLCKVLLLFLEIAMFAEGLACPGLVP